MNNYLKNRSIKIVNIALLLVSTGLYFGVNLYWSEVCRLGKCSNLLMDGFLSPLEEAGLWLGVIFFAFLFLPTHYFKYWLRYFFVWALPLSVWLIASIDPGNSSVLAISPEQGVQVLAVVWVIITAGIVGNKWYRNRKSETSNFK